MERLLDFVIGRLQRSVIGASEDITDKTSASAARAIRLMRSTGMPYGAPMRKRVMRGGALAATAVRR
jgi:hypothetical protein